MHNRIHVALDIRTNEIRAIIDGHHFIFTGIVSMPETSYFELPKEQLNNILVINGSSKQSARLYYFNPENKLIDTYSLVDTILISISKALIELNIPSTKPLHISLAVGTSDDLLLHRTTELECTLTNTLTELCSSSHIISSPTESFEVIFDPQLAYIIPSTIGTLLNETTDSFGSLIKKLPLKKEPLTTLYVNLDVTSCSFTLATQNKIDDFVSCCLKLSHAETFLLTNQPSQDCCLDFGNELINALTEFILSIPINIDRIVVSGTNAYYLKQYLLDAFSYKSPFLQEDNIVVTHELLKSISVPDTAQFVNVSGFYKYLLGITHTKGGPL